MPSVPLLRAPAAPDSDSNIGGCIKAKPELISRMESVGEDTTPTNTTSEDEASTTSTSAASDSSSCSTPRNKNISATNLRCLPQLKKALAKELADEKIAYLLDDVLLARFLEARKQNVAEAYKMLHKYLDWRKTMRPELIRADDPAVRKVFGDGAIRLIPTRSSTSKKQLAPIIYMQASLWKPSGYTAAEFGKAWAYLLEHCQEEYAKKRGIIPNVIIDLEGCSVTQTQYKDHIAQIINLGQESYPGMVGHVYMLSANVIFRSFWAIIAPLINETARKKVKFFGNITVTQSPPSSPKTSNFFSAIKATVKLQSSPEQVLAQRRDLINNFGAEVVPSRYGGQLNIDKVPLIPNL